MSGGWHGREKTIVRTISLLMPAETAGNRARGIGDVTLEVILHLTVDGDNLLTLPFGLDGCAGASVGARAPSDCPS